MKVYAWLIDLIYCRKNCPTGMISGWVQKVTEHRGTIQWCMPGNTQFCHVPSTSHDTQRRNGVCFCEKNQHKNPHHFPRKINGPHHFSRRKPKIPTIFHEESTVPTILHKETKNPHHFPWRKPKIPTILHKESTVPAIFHEENQKSLPFSTKKTTVLLRTTFYATKKFQKVPHRKTSNFQKSGRNKSTYSWNSALKNHLFPSVESFFRIPSNSSMTWSNSCPSASSSS